MRTFGLAEFRRAIDMGFDMADVAEATLRSDGRWEIVTPSQMGVLTFRWRDASKSDSEIDAITPRRRLSACAKMYALVMSTVLRGRPVLRICAINPTSRVEEMKETIARLGRFSEAAARGESVS